VDVVVGRAQVAAPNQIKTRLNSSTFYNFNVRNVPATIQVNDPAPGTFVLITPNRYSGNTPPVIDMTSASPTVAWTKTIGLDGTAQIQVPRGTYYITCWKQVICSGTIQSLPTTSSPVSAGTTLSPGNPTPYTNYCGATPECP
jgi:hypothetical protein